MLPISNVLCCFGEKLFVSNYIKSLHATNYNDVTRVPVLSFRILIMTIKQFWLSVIYLRR